MEDSSLSSSCPSSLSSLSWSSPSSSSTSCELIATLFLSPFVNLTCCQKTIPRRITKTRCPTRRRQEEKRGGVGGNPPLSSSLSPTHNHIAVRPRADVLSPINHGQPDTRWSVLYFICGQREPDKNTFTLYTMLQPYVDKDDKDTAKSPRALLRKHRNVQGRLAALPHTR